MAKSPPIPLGEKQQSLSITIPRATAEISGIVKDQAGKPAPNVTVDINGGETYPHSVKTDATGHFTFKVAEGAQAIVYLRRPMGAPRFPAASRTASAGQTDLELQLPPP